MRDWRRPASNPARMCRSATLRASPTGIRTSFACCAATGIAASLAPPDALPAGDDVLVQQKITVTGSRIKRVDGEGPQPVCAPTS
jgi:hypothetical protein